MSNFHLAIAAAKCLCDGLNPRMGEHLNYSLIGAAKQEQGIKPAFEALRRGLLGVPRSSDFITIVETDKDLHVPKVTVGVRLCNSAGVNLGYELSATFLYWIDKPALSLDYLGALRVSSDPSEAIQDVFRKRSSVGLSFSIKNFQSSYGFIPEAMTPEEAKRMEDTLRNLMEIDVLDVPSRLAVQRLVLLLATR